MKFIQYLLFILMSLICAKQGSGQTYNMIGGTITTCSGTFYDPGGAGNYANNQNITETFCSSSGCLSINFTSFRTQGGNDILTIYDGPNITSPLIGAFSGTTSPGIVTSSTGCLTFKFVSNSSTVRTGWQASISCGTCATNYILNNNVTVNTCSGLFYDSGGPASSYGISDNYTKSFCSSNGSCMQIKFISFSTKAGDILSFYDGPNTSSPLIGNFAGTTLPPTLISSTGCLTVKFAADGNNQVSSGWQALISCVICPTPPGSATYIHPVAGLQNAYVGVNMVATCGGTYTDNGGTTSNYSNNINSIYRTFCPSQAGQCLRVNFWNFDIQPTFDNLTILNGPTQNSPQFGAGSQWSGTASSYQAAMAAGIGPYTSTDQSGCLTFRFASDLTTTRAGWVATFNCIPCSNGPNGTDNNDCLQAMPICSNQSFSDASTGPGIVSDGGGGCVLSENFSNWYKIVIQVGGTLGLNIVPNVTADDYDFALYQSSSCASLGPPVRCSYASNTGTTGMNNALNLSTNTAICGTANNGSDNNEDVCGNGWVNTITVTAGQVFYLLVNKWTPGGSGFTLNWVLTGGASLNCAVLPVELMAFDVIPSDKSVNIFWETASEINNDYFIVERSSDSQIFSPVELVDGAGNSSILREYKTIDSNPLRGISYYRLKQVDYDGNFSISDIKAVDLTKKGNMLYAFPNPAQHESIIYFSIDDPALTTLQLMDLNGRLVVNTIVHATSGINTFHLDLNKINRGIYLLMLVNGKDIIRTKLVID